MRNSFEAVPRELEEAAVIDGASSWQVLVRICLPAIRPAIVTVALFAFITSWNEFLGALVMMNRGVDVHAAADPRQRAAGDEHRRHGLGHAAGRASPSRSLPCVLFYLLLQKYYVSGFTSGAVK